MVEQQFSEFPGTNRLEISFENGKLVAENNKLHIYRNKDSKTEYNVEVFEPTEVETAHIGILQNFVNKTLHDEPLICPGEDGLCVLSIINSAYLSSWESQKKSLPFDHENYYKKLKMHYAVDGKVIGEKPVKMQLANSALDGTLNGNFLNIYYLYL